MDQTLKNVLLNIGLTEQEIEIYTIALEHGEMSIGKFATKTNISRPNLYKIMERLESKNIGSFSHKNKYKRRFSVKSPSVIAELLHKQVAKNTSLEKDFKKMMPELMMLFKQGSSPTRIRTLFGRKEFLETFDIILNEGVKEIYFCGSFQDFVTFTSWEKQQEFVIKRKEKKIKAFGLIFTDKDAKQIKDGAKQQLREVRYLDKKYFFTTSFQVFGNKVIIWQPETPMAILIEDENIAKMMLQIFKNLWDTKSQ